MKKREGNELVTSREAKAVCLYLQNDGNRGPAHAMRVFFSQLLKVIEPDPFNQLNSNKAVF